MKDQVKVRCAELCCAVLCCAVLCCAVLCYAMLHCFALSYAVLCCAMLRCAATVFAGCMPMCAMLVQMCRRWIQSWRGTTRAVLRWS